MLETYHPSSISQGRYVYCDDSRTTSISHPSSSNSRGSHDLPSLFCLSGTPLLVASSYQISNLSQPSLIPYAPTIEDEAQGSEASNPPNRDSDSDSESADSDCKSTYEPGGIGGGFEDSEDFDDVEDEFLLSGDIILASNSLDKDDDLQSARSTHLPLRLKEVRFLQESSEIPSNQLKPLRLLVSAPKNSMEPRDIREAWRAALI
jgi:hypothetical protein